MEEPVRPLEPANSIQPVEPEEPATAVSSLRAFKSAAKNDANAVADEVSKWRLFHTPGLLLFTGNCRRPLVNDIEANVSPGEVVRYAVADSTYSPGLQSQLCHIQQFKSADAFMKALFVLSSYTSEKPKMLVIEDVGKFFTGNGDRADETMTSALDYLSILTSKSVVVVYVTGDVFDR